MAEKLHSGHRRPEPDLHEPQGPETPAASAVGEVRAEVLDGDEGRAGDFLRVPGTGAGPDRRHIPAGALPEQKGHQTVDVQHPGCL